MEERNEFYGKKDEYIGVEGGVALSEDGQKYLGRQNKKELLRKDLQEDLSKFGTKSWFTRTREVIKKHENLGGETRVAILTKRVFREELQSSRGGSVTKETTNHVTLKIAKGIREKTIDPLTGEELII